MSKMWINMESATGAFAQTLLGYSNFTTNDIDYGYDGKLNADGALALYTKAANTVLVIQARSEFTIADIVPLYYRAAAAGEYTIKLDRKDGVFANGQNVYLRNNQANTVHDFSMGAYTFAALQGTTEGRFDIIYTATGNNILGNEVPQLAGKDIIIYNKENTLMVETPGTMIREVRIFDVRGRLLHEQKNTESEIMSIKLAAQQQMLIVQLTSVEGVTASKKVIY